jgi:hypothetical protein
MQTEGICLLHHIIKDIGESIIYTVVKLFTLLYRIVLEENYLQENAKINEIFQRAGKY